MSLRATAAAFVKEGGIGLAIVVLLSLVVWLGGDYFGLSPLVAQAVIAAMVGLSVAMFVVRRLLARRQAKRLAAKFMELAAQDADATLGERKAKQEEIAALLREGVAHLRMSEHGEKAVSELPWYLVVGTPGSGKSTLLEQSGLSFTPMGRVRKPVSEAGTTRDLDWWLTDSAVFLDVPGRYISSLDSPFEWPAFVGALKEARAHAPVSGVIIVLPLPEILDLKNDEVEPYAKKFNAKFVAGKKPWEVPVDMAFPCAIQNELDENDATTLIKNGCKYVIETSNMGCTAGAVTAMHKAHILFAPGKAANAGGVATSGLEMAQNGNKLSWTAEEVDQKLHRIMTNIHAAGVKYGRQKDGYIDYVKGSNIAGFIKVADAMLDMGY